MPSSTRRDPADQAEVDAAISLLESDPRTVDTLAPRLRSEHNAAGSFGVAGWKWLEASRRVLGPSVTDSQRRSWPYFAKIAENLDESDRGGGAKAKPETKAQRKQREWKAKLDRLIAERGGGKEDTHAGG